MDSVTPERRQADQLLELALAQGERLIGGGNRPIRLSDPGTLWFVVQGSVDVFATRLREDGVPTDFKHLLRAGSGRLLFNAAEEAGPSVLVAKGLPDSELRRIPLDALATADLQAEMVEQANTWVSDLSESIAGDVTFRPQIDLELALDGADEVSGGTTIAVQHGVTWAFSESGDMQYLGTEELDQSKSLPVPITAFSWVVQGRTARVKAISTSELHGEGRLLAALAEFNCLAMRADRTNRALLLADVSNLQTASARYRRRSAERARRNLFSVLSSELPTEDDSGLLRVLGRIGRHEGISFRASTQAQRRASSSEDTTLEDILNVSGVRFRRVAFKNNQRWWLSDSGAMLASYKQDGAPVALIPGASGRYLMVDPHTSRSVRVNAQRAALLDGTAYFFYCPLPDEQTSNAASLLGMVFHRVRSDLARLVGAGILSGLAMLAPAAFLGAIASQVLPSGDLSALVMLTAAMVMGGLVLTLAQMVKGTALMRLEGRAVARISAALWDRMLLLPSSFFRRFTVGDLGSRALGFQHLRDRVAGVVAGSMLTLIFLLPASVLMLVYDSALGGLGLGVGVASLAVTLYIGVRQLPHHRRLLAASRRLTGVLLQLISGVAKLRVAGAEESGFAMWAAHYREQKQAEMQLGSLNEHLIAFVSAAPYLAVAGLFAVALERSEHGLPIGSFLAMYAAFMIFYGAVVQFGLSFSAIAAILPTVEQTAPILAERPKRSIADAPVLELQGELRIDHVTFRYTEDGPLVLQDVSLYARPGEFIALVGESGSGKSTMLRLALGLESPLSGAVYYDGHDLERLNRHALRNGVGTVVQDASLRPQTVLDNIIGTGNDLTVEDAWRAARLASVDQDLEAMPMGMYTVTSEGSTAFSGGQAQRIMLAGALVRNPRVILLDEATNWLDNETQSSVMEQIEKLSVTRIASAHRLSTIRRADRIYVLKNGQVVQQGSFDELMAEEGTFRDMALRQMA